MLKEPPAYYGLLPDPETLRAYASLFEKPYRDASNGLIREPGEPARAAAIALRLCARRIEMEIDKHE